jgi:hypothetical protein
MSTLRHDQPAANASTANVSTSMLQTEINALFKLVHDESKVINDIICKRNRILSFSDILHFLCRKTLSGNDYETMLGFFKFEKIFDVVPSAIKKFRHKIDNAMFLRLNDKLISHIYSEHTRRFIAVDGSQINLNKCVSKSFSLSKNKGYCVGFLSSLFDIEKGCIINLGLFNDKDERASLITQIEQGYVKQGDVLIADRGYYSLDLLKFLRKHKIDIIFRCRNNYINFMFT